MSKIYTVTFFVSGEYKIEVRADDHDHAAEEATRLMESGEIDINIVGTETNDKEEVTRPVDECIAVAIDSISQNDLGTGKRYDRWHLEEDGSWKKIDIT